MYIYIYKNKNKNKGRVIKNNKKSWVSIETPTTLVKQATIKQCSNTLASKNEDVDYLVSYKKTYNIIRNNNVIK